MSKKLYLHIGTHKTGTTSIQKALVENQDKLQERGLSYFYDDVNGVKSPIFNVHTWFGLNNDFVQDGFTLGLKSKFAQEISKLSGDVIASSENFSWFFNSKELIELKKELDKYFNQVFIILYIRRQDTHIISHRNEGSKSSHRPAAVFYGHGTTALSPYQKSFDQYLDYYKKVQMWSSVFGKENMIIKIFDRKLMYQKDVVADFFHLFDIEDIKLTKSNVSNGFEKTKVRLLMNQMNMPDGILRNIISAYLSDEGKLLPPKEEAIAFYAHYRESNQTLNEEFHLSDIHDAIFDDDFSSYPDKPHDRWDEESANSAITNILRGTQNHFGAIDPNILVNSALKLEKIDFKLSFRLMNMALQLLPQNEFIQKRLKLYKTSLEKNS